MKHFTNLLLFLSTCLGSALVLSACGAGTLDGGSNASGSSGATPAPSGSSGSKDPDGNLSQDGIGDGPFRGTVVGKPFTATAFELTPETKSSRWTLQIHNASEPCARGRRLGEDVVIVTIDGLGGQGSWPLDVGDGHFQRGFYTTADAEKPETDTATQGRVRLDTAPGAAGTTVTGGLLVKGATSELQGTFTATVCAPR
jgi:hypothetical protein